MYCHLSAHSAYHDDDNHSYSDHSRKQGARVCLPVSIIALLSSASVCMHIG